MDSFYEKLGKINIIEIIAIFLIAEILSMFLGSEGILSYILAIAYILIRTRTEISSVKNSVNTLFDKISLKTCLLLVLANYLFALSIGYYTDQFIAPSADYYILGQFFIFGTIGTLALDFISSVMIGPIAEELVFRGILLQNIIDKKWVLILGILICGYIYAMPITAISGIISIACMIGAYLLYRKTQNIFIPILISSGIFGLFHPITGLFSAIIFGICMCVVYLKTNNLALAILLHALNNLISFIVPYTPNLEQIFDNPITLPIVGILGIVSLVYILKFIYESYDDIKVLNETMDKL